MFHLPTVMHAINQYKHRRSGREFWLYVSTLTKGTRVHKDLCKVWYNNLNDPWQMSDDALNLHDFYCKIM